MKLNLDRYNDRIQEWGKDTIEAMQSEADSLGIEHRSDSPSKGPSMQKLKDRYQYEDGGVNKVSIKFPRVLIYTHKGAGKGRGGAKGSRWTDKYGKEKSTNKNSLGKAGTAGRKAKPFFDNVLDGDQGVEKLADIVVEETGDIIIHNLFID